MFAPLALATVLLTPQDKPVEVVVDTSGAPEVAGWAAKAKTLVEKWYPTLSKWLASPGYTPPQQVRLVFRHMDGVAGTGGNEIGISAAWVTQHPDDWGMVIHELTHVVQRYPHYNPSWLVEGIADYIRYFRFEPGARPMPVQAAKANYRQGYGTVARFLDWAQRKANKDLVFILNRELRQDVYKAADWQTLTKHSFDDLWKEYLVENDWTIQGFRRVTTKPILVADATHSFRCPMTQKAVAWEGGQVFNPAAVARDGQVFLLYRAEDATGAGIGLATSRIGLAASDNGLAFNRVAAPVLYPGEDAGKAFEWPGGCEDPRVVAGAGGYVMTYTAWDRKVARLCVATSSDLVLWSKKGPAFAKAAGGKWRDTWSKSGSIVSKVAGDSLAATKIGGKYWMYWGEGAVHLATSTNLTDWTPVVDAEGKLAEVLRTRRGRFDSGLVEPGPPAIATAEGIVLLYNGKNAEANGDPKIAIGAYCAGQALFSLKDPARLIDRMDAPFLAPSEPFEVTGQYQAGTVFIEGLVPFHGLWRLYYGCADSAIGVATALLRKS